MFIKIYVRKNTLYDYYKFLKLGKHLNILSKYFVYGKQYFYVCCIFLFNNKQKCDKGHIVIL